MDKPIPDEPFPHVNTTEAFSKSLDEWRSQVARKTIRNVALMTSVLILGIAAVLSPKIVLEYPGRLQGLFV